MRQTGQPDRRSQHGKQSEAAPHPQTAAMLKRPTAPAALALLSAGLFGISTPLAKLLVSAMPPLMLAALLYLGSGVGLALVLLVQRVRRAADARLVVPHGRDWLWLCAAILAGGCAAPVLLAYGLQTSPASSAALLLNLEGVFTALLAWFVFKENFDSAIAIGMALTVAGGVVLVLAPGAAAGFSAGLGLVVAACAAWAIDNNLTRKVAASDATLTACLKGLAAGTVNLVLAWTLVPTTPVSVNAMLGALAVGFVGYGVSLVLFVLALRGLGAARTGAYFSAAPFFGATAAMVVLGEPLGLGFAAGAVLMASGVWLHARERHEHEHTHDALEHDHRHVHDEHHQHGHAEGVSAAKPHAHRHRHEVLMHRHPHYPDIHHQHRHG